MRPKLKKRATSQMHPNTLNALKISKFAMSTLYTVRIEKTGRVWCGGARETQGATCHNEVTSKKTKEFL